MFAVTSTWADVIKFLGGDDDLYWMQADREHTECGAIYPGKVYLWVNRPGNINDVLVFDPCADSTLKLLPYVCGYEIEIELTCPSGWSQSKNALPS